MWLLAIRVLSHRGQTPTIFLPGVDHRANLGEIQHMIQHMIQHKIQHKNSGKEHGGLSKMKESMWRADPVQGQMFSDMTDSSAGQQVLLQPEVDLSPLRKALQSRFRGQGWVWIETVEQYVFDGHSVFRAHASEAAHTRPDGEGRVAER